MWKFDDLSDGNRRFFSASGNVRRYVESDRNAILKPAEAKIFAELADEFRGKAILDLGVGAGRTTPHLLAISANYTGTDYAAGMVEASRQRFPGVTFMECDARKMPMFADGQFDLIVFSYNGIDSNGPEDRLLILEEIYRLLANDGAFVFSSLNRDRRTERAHELGNLKWSLNPAKMGYRTARYLAGIWNQSRMRKHERDTPDYAIRNAYDSLYTIVLHYITLQKQLSQLAAIGFRSVVAYNVQGQILAPDAHDTGVDIHYVARKSAPIAA